MNNPMMLTLRELIAFYEGIRAYWAERDDAGMVRAWSRTIAGVKREGVRPYGFRRNLDLNERVQNPLWRHEVSAEIRAGLVALENYRKGVA